MPSFFLSGANSLLDRKKLQSLGGFDEVYAPFYNEDLDLCLKAWRLGWKCYYEPNSVCLHPNSATISKYHKSKKVKVISFRNKIIVHLIHLEGIYLFLYYIQLALSTLGKILTLKFYYLDAFSQVYQKKSEWISTKKKMVEMEKYTGKRNAVQNVVKDIKLQLKGKNIIQF